MLKIFKKWDMYLSEIGQVPFILRDHKPTNPGGVVPGGIGFLLKKNKKK
jgi:hypothetical protein